MTSSVREKVDLSTYQLKLLLETDGKRGRYREITVDSGAGESVVNPDDWPNVDLKTIKGLSERTTIRGPWRGKDRQS